MIYYTDGNYSKALAGAYPEVTFDKAKFHWSQDPFSCKSHLLHIFFTSSSFCFCFCFCFCLYLFVYIFLFLVNDSFVATWKNRVYRKSFFDKFAKSQGFDPLVAKNWYNVTLSQIKQQKVYIYI